ncbi:MAG: phage major capsid protein [Actinomycetota bacterium]|nr:phage major capsid protein [Actinomycetota bacterium]
MAFTAATPNSAQAWRPDVYEFAPADIIPEALVLQCTTVGADVEGDAPAVRVAYVDDDEAQLSDEADEIPEAQPDLAERVIYTSKVTQLVRLSNEQFLQPTTAENIAQSVARAVTRRGDLFFVQQAAPTAPAVAPVAGLANVTGLVDGGTVADTLDGLIDLIAQLQQNLATPSLLLLDPTGWASFRKLKATTNQSILGVGTTDAQQMLLSLPVIVNVAVPQGIGFVIDRRAIMSAVGTLKVATSDDRYFETDSVGVRATWRLGHTVVRPERIGTFTIGAGGS